MAAIKMYYTGEEDFWGRKILKSNTNTYQEVDGQPHFITSEGEPISPVPYYKIVSSESELMSSANSKNSNDDH